MSVAGSAEFEATPRNSETTLSWPVARAFIVLLLALGGSIALSTSEDWEPAWLLACLLVMAAVAELGCVRLGGVRMVPNDVALALAILILGPLPAVAIAAVGVVLDTALGHLGWRLCLVNLATMSMQCAAGAVVFASASGWGWATPGEGGLLATAIAVVAVQYIAGAASVWVTNPHGLAVAGAEVRRAQPVVLPWVAMNALVIAGAVHAYFTIGGSVIVVCAVVQVTLALQLRAVEHSEGMRRDLAEEQRSRERAAAAVLDARAAARREFLATVHDDALQDLLAARQDLIEVERGDNTRLSHAAGSLNAGLTRLRELMAHGVTHHGIETPLEEGLSDALARLREHGVRCELRVDTKPQSDVDPFLLQIGCELISNAFKHASAGMFSLHVFGDNRCVTVAARDDGLGFDPSQLSRSVAEGHVGLALLRERVGALGGSMRIASARGAGTRIAVEIPLQTLA